MRVTIQLILCWAAVTAFDTARAGNWTRFRGPNGQGISSEVDLPERWSQHDNLAWKTSISGNAWSPLVALQNLLQGLRGATLKRQHPE